MTGKECKTAEQVSESLSVTNDTHMAEGTKEEEDTTTGNAPEPKEELKSVEIDEALTESLTDKNSSGTHMAEGTEKEVKATSPEKASIEETDNMKDDDNDSEDFDMDWPENPVTNLEPESVSEKVSQLIDHPSQGDDSQPFDLMEE